MKYRHSVNCALEFRTVVRPSNSELDVLCGLNYAPRSFIYRGKTRTTTKQIPASSASRF